MSIIDPNRPPNPSPVDRAIDVGTDVGRYAWRGVKRTARGALIAGHRGGLIGFGVYALVVFLAWALPFYALNATLGALAALLWLPALLLVVGAPWTGRGHAGRRESPNWWDRLPAALQLPSVGLIKGGQANAGTVAARMVGRAQEIDGGVMAVYDLFGGITWRQVDAKRDVIAAALRLDEELVEVDKMGHAGQVSVFVRSGAYVPDPQTAREDAIVERITAALTPRLVTAGGSGETLTVAVSRWDEHGAPERVEVGYPAAAGDRVHAAQHGAALLLGRAYPPPAGTWTVKNDAAADVLTFTVEADPLTAALTPAQPEESVDLLAGPVLGRVEDGTEWRTPLAGGASTLIVGSTGSGKGSVLWGQIAGLEHMIRRGEVRLWLADPKFGQEFGIARDIAWRYAETPEDIAALLVDAAEAMAAKGRANAASGDRKMDKPTRQRPMDLIVVDELARVTGAREAKVRASNMTSLSELLGMGRTTLSTVIAASQKPQKENLPLRDDFPVKVVLRLETKDETNLVLGAGAADRGARPDLIPRQGMQGTAYVVNETVSGDEKATRRVRAAYITDAYITEMIARIAASPLAWIARGPDADEDGPQVDDEPTAHPLVAACITAVEATGSDVMYAAAMAAALDEDLMDEEGITTAAALGQRLAALGVKKAPKGERGARYSLDGLRAAPPITRQ